MPAQRRHREGFEPLIHCLPNAFCHACGEAFQAETAGLCGEKNFKRYMGRLSGTTTFARNKKQH